MTTWTGFLRAVNVGKRQYPMAELRAALTGAGFTNVETHIQTGNVRLETRRRSRETTAAALEKAMADDRGFEVPVVLLRPAELVRVAEEADELADGRDLVAHYITLLADEPSKVQIDQVEALSLDREEVRVGARAVHLLLEKSFHEARSPAKLDRIGLGVLTARNATVIRKLADKWGS